MSILGFRFYGNNEYPTKQLFTYLFDILLIFLIFIAVALSLYADSIQLFDKVNWLQSSGSVIVLISAILEYRYFKHKNNHPHQSVLNGGTDAGKFFSICYKLKFRIGASSIHLLVFGTLVWGYGDLF